MGDNTLAVTDKDFEQMVLKSDVPVLVDFWAPWCGPCLAIAPVLDAIASEFETKIKVVKMNVDENANVPASYGVRSIPFLAVFKGGEVVDSLVGAVPKSKLTEMVEKAIG